MNHFPTGVDILRQVAVPHDLSPTPVIEQRLIHGDERGESASTARTMNSLDPWRSSSVKRSVMHEFTANPAFLLTG
jgi:hypothetical protein